MTASELTYADLGCIVTWGSMAARIDRLVICDVEIRVEEIDQVGRVENFLHIPPNAEVDVLT